MISSIELKSDDFNDENFSPVFSRLKKESYLSIGDKYRKDMAVIGKITANKHISDVLEKYYGGKHNNTHWREWPVEKFVLGWGVGYLLLRELPIRNFYARCFIMVLYFSKIKDLIPNLLPGYSPTFVAVKDRYTGKNVINYDAVYLNQFQITPDASNRVHEGLLWKWRQPAYMKDTPEMWVGTYFPWAFGGKGNHHASWDGTFNMPLERLADAWHKDCMMVDFLA